MLPLLSVMLGAYSVMGPAMFTKLFKVRSVRLPALPKVKPLSVVAKL